jgi:hypothetical protein
VKPQTTLEFTPQQVASERQNGLAHGNAPSAAKPSLAIAGPVRRHAAGGAVALAAFLALWLNAPRRGLALGSDSYLWHVVRFSFWQAFLSALLSVGRPSFSPAPFIGVASRAAHCCCACAR